MNSPQKFIPELEKKIDVSPDMQFYNLLESFPYTVKNALSEYIDNALEAYRTAKKNSIKNLPEILTITIDITKKRIIIDDNGTGIAASEIQRAMKPAAKSKEQSLNEFGIGMKAASVWFGKKWTLKSYPFDGTQPFSLNFDLNELLIEGIHELTINKIENREYSGVEIILENLHHEIDEEQAKRVWKDLQETYQLFCSRKDPEPILNLILKYNNKTLEKVDFSTIIVANEALVFPLCKLKNNLLYAIGPDITWKTNIEFKFNGKKVHGFISLGKESSQKTNPGLRLFRYGRLIKGTSDAHFRPQQLLGQANKHAPSRFYAELHLDGQAISNSKGEFTFDEYLFLQEIEKIPEVKQYIEQAENYRSIKAAKGQYIHFETLEEFEKKTNKKLKKTNFQHVNNLKNIGDFTIKIEHSGIESKIDIIDENDKLKNDENINDNTQNNDLYKISEKEDNIIYSKELNKYLTLLKVNKLPKFYKSLCRISLTKDPLVAYVCAWSMLESLKTFINAGSQSIEFSAFYNNKLSKMYQKTDKNKMKKFVTAITEIHQKGNLCKHDGEYEILNATQLNFDFKTLEPLLIYCIKEKLNQSNDPKNSI